MNMIYRFFGVAAAFAVLTVAPGLANTASAADGKGGMKAGMYASGYLGVSNFEDSNNQGAVLSVENEFDTGYALAGAVGYDYGNGFRLEGELS